MAVKRFIRFVSGFTALSTAGTLAIVLALLMFWKPNVLVAFKDPILWVNLEGDVDMKPIVEFIRIKSDAIV